MTHRLKVVTAIIVHRYASYTLRKNTFFTKTHKFNNVHPNLHPTIHILPVCTTRRFQGHL